QAAHPLGELEAARPSLPPTADSNSLRAFFEALRIFQSENNATLHKRRGTSFPTNPERRARIGPALVPIRALRFFPAAPIRATFPRTGGPANVRTRHEYRLMCRSRLPFQTVRGCANKIPTQLHKGRVPCTWRTEWVRARGFQTQSFPAGSLFPLPPFFHILRRANEHLDQIIMQRIIKLTLKCPLKL